MNDILLLWLLAVIALAIGTAQVYLALTEAVPLAWLYWHAHLRKPLLWIITIAGALIALSSINAGDPPGWVLLPFALQVVALVMTYRLHQETVFEAVTSPPFTTDPAASPVDDAMEVALLEADGDVRAYPLVYVEHHHVVNDRIGDRLIALTFCAMCRTIIAFDVTELGPLYVASFKNGNLVLADRQTRTFFQQATFESVIGPRHPQTLPFYPSQILPWGAAKTLDPAPAIVAVRPQDLRPFALPIPGVWQRILRSEATPGLSAASRDRRFPMRTRVLGVAHAGREWVYLKTDVLAHNSVVNQDGDFILLVIGDTVSGFAGSLDGQQLRLALGDGDGDGDGDSADTMIRDAISGTTWDLRGRYVAGSRQQDLAQVPVSDEYWFSWAKFHPDATVVRLDAGVNAQESPVRATLPLRQA